MASLTYLPFVSFLAELDKTKFGSNVRCAMLIKLEGTIDPALTNELKEVKNIFKNKLSKFLSVTASEVSVEEAYEGSVFFLFLVPLYCVEKLGRAWTENRADLQKALQLTLGQSTEPVAHLTAVLGDSDPHFVELIKATKIVSKGED